MAEDSGISVVISTRNRAARLRLTLQSLARQRAPDIPWEILVADNGSSDDTEPTVRGFARCSPVPVLYLLEPTPGVSHARNAATHFSSREFVAFLDDDQDIDPDWLARLARHFLERPGVDVIGGRVLPRWMDPPPDWLTDEIRGPVAIIDRGEQPFLVTRDRWMCLPGGNMAWRRGALIEVGGFSVDYPRAQDRELLVRTLLQDGCAMYAPDVIVYHRLERGRLTREFFRNWYRSEGRMRAGYAFEELFTRDGYLRPIPAGTPRVLGVSRYLYRQWMRALASYLMARLGVIRRDPFPHELRLRMLSAYLRRRIELTAGPHASPLHRLCAAVARTRSPRRGAVPSGRQPVTSASR
jgi:glycosyltransferase involved in cell wall biosynthesis